MTLWPAWQHFEEDRKGSIEVGKLADLVVLSGNPMTTPEDQLVELKVVETYKEGVSIYKRPEHAAVNPSPAMFGTTVVGPPGEDHHALPGLHPRGDGCFNHGLSLLMNAIDSAAE